LTGTHFRVGDTDAVKRLVMAHHYSHRMPANVQVAATWHDDGGLFGDYGNPVAACVLSIPPTRWAEPVHELSRLVRCPEMHVPISGLISNTMRHAQSIGIDIVVSFADASAGHHGGVYQAASWNYHGRRNASMDGIMIDGVFVPGRSCNSSYGTRSPDKLAAMLSDHSIEPHYDIGKHLYWKALNKNGARVAARLGLAKTAYPKPGAGHSPEPGNMVGGNH